eukprot:scaffold1318_cov106-Isochrysis_galbana.AAC.1
MRASVRPSPLLCTVMPGRPLARCAQACPCSPVPPFPSPRPGPSSRHPAPSPWLSAAPCASAVSLPPHNSRGTTHASSNPTAAPANSPRRDTATTPPPPAVAPPRTSPAPPTPSPRRRSSSSASLFLSRAISACAASILESASWRSADSARAWEERSRSCSARVAAI